MSSTVTKEVCSKCNCIVKERKIGGSGNGNCGNNGNSGNCKATIVGVITLPDELCHGNRIDTDNSDCKVVYRDLGECLQKCIVKVSKETGSGGKSKGCDW